MPYPTKDVPKPTLIKAADHDKLSVYFNLYNSWTYSRALSNGQRLC